MYEAMLYLLKSPEYDRNLEYQRCLGGGVERGRKQGEFVYFRIEDARRSGEKEKGRVSRSRFS